MGIVKEFKEFALKGNVLDLAVGVIIGGAFGKIVSSVVEHILMPPIGLITGGVDFKDLKIILKAANVAEKTSEVAIQIGLFINNVIDFVIVAFCIFLVIKGINKLTAKKEAEEAAPAPDPSPTKEELLLTEIRDLLKK